MASPSLVDTQLIEALEHQTRVILAELDKRFTALDSKWEARVQTHQVAVGAVVEWRPQVDASIEHLQQHQADQPHLRSVGNMPHEGGLLSSAITKQIEPVCLKELALLGDADSRVQATETDVVFPSSKMLSLVGAVDKEERHSTQEVPRRAPRRNALRGGTKPTPSPSSTTTAPLEHPALGSRETWSRASSTLCSSASCSSSRWRACATRRTRAWRPTRGTCNASGRATHSTQAPPSPAASGTSPPPRRCPRRSTGMWRPATTVGVGSTPTSTLLHTQASTAPWVEEQVSGSSPLGCSTKCLCQAMQNIVKPNPPRMNEITGAARLKPQGSFHYGSINGSQIYKMRNEPPVIINGKKRVIVSALVWRIKSLDIMTSYILPKPPWLAFDPGKLFRVDYSSSSTSASLPYALQFSLDVQTMETVDIVVPNQRYTTGEQVSVAVSVAATQGLASVNTMKFQGIIQGVKVAILVDSGSSHSFVSADLASQLSSVVGMVTLVSVQVADGGLLQCYCQLLGAKWMVQQCEFSTNFRVLDISAYNVIVDMDWLSSYSSMKVHWAQWWVIIPYQGSFVLLHGCSAVLPPRFWIIDDGWQETLDYYPETLHQMLVANADGSFKLPGNSVKDFLDSKTALKIHVLITNFQNKLLEVINATELPEFLGGPCTYTMGGCLMSNKGPWNDPDTMKLSHNKEAKFTRHNRGLLLWLVILKGLLTHTR
ncbi:ataxin isoform X2 [Zea mays]|uniref:ataxin isoform X2 n=1 Tax=Zea mays TaxID=4577 RepID=UPI001652D035|nr:ataxin isoform X2 [Zea mays]